MAKKLSNIHLQLKAVIDANFGTNDIALESTVHSVDLIKNYFVIIENESNIKCYTELKISELNVGDIIRLQGKLRSHPNNISELCIYVEYFYNMDHVQHHEIKMKNYISIKNKLQDSKCKKLISYIKSKPVPNNIYNVGLVVILENLDSTKSESVNIFKDKFNKLCVGQLFIYYVSVDNVNINLKYGLEFFKKYYDIDMICILLDKIDPSTMADIVSYKNINYMMSRKNSPYTICLMETNVTNLIVDMCNYHCTTVDDVIQIILSKQNKNIVINYALLESLTIIKNKILTYENTIQKISYQYGCLLSRSPVNILNEILINKLNEQKNNLVRIENHLGRNLFLSRNFYKNLKEKIEINNLNINNSTYNENNQIILSNANKIKNSRTGSDSESLTDLSESEFNEGLDPDIEFSGDFGSGEFF